ncbi:DnaD domain protein [Tuberibacillus sp. Marseille-P3662]|uniref:DnaD domain protein n=1 Tax=Tuberibacillus sp. Marseille-P3662 TaxID=1965358 RepID=UPI000A1CEAC8|nr:DnaD domain protein [Tuberibacillus sp. Marseille-P3662]
MNYLRELNAFYNRMETMELSTSAIALWHALMHINNNAGWREQFTVSLSVLSGKSGLSQRMVSKARSELNEKGFIDFQPRRGSQSGQYQIRRLSEPNFEHDSNNASSKPSNLNASKRSDNSSSPHDLADGHSNSDSTNRSTNRSNNRSNNRSTLIKQDKTKPSDMLIDTLQNSFSDNFSKRATTKQLNTLQSYVEQQGFEVNLVCHALSLSGERGKTFQYAKAILNNWVKKGIRTLDAAKKDSQAFTVAQRRGVTGSIKKGGTHHEESGGSGWTNSDIPARVKLYR